MKRVPSPHRPMYRTLTLSCDDVLFERIATLALRDGVSRSRVLRELVMFALPVFEDEAGEKASTAVEAGNGAAG